MDVDFSTTVQVEGRKRFPDDVGRWRFREPYLPVFRNNRLVGDVQQLPLVRVEDKAGTSSAVGDPRGLAHQKSPHRIERGVAVEAVQHWLLDRTPFHDIASSNVGDWQPHRAKCWFLQQLLRGGSSKSTRGYEAGRKAVLTAAAQPPPGMRISVEGNIGCGKSELLRRLATLGYYVVPEPVVQWQPMLSLFYGAKQRWAMAMNLTALESFQTVPETAPDGGPVICERSPLSCIQVFSRLQRNEGLMTEKEWQLCQDLHDLVSWTPDVIVYLVTPVTTCLNRVHLRNRPGEEGIDFDYMTKLHNAHSFMLRYCKPEYHVVDSSKDAAVVAARVHDIIGAYVPKKLPGS